MVRASVVANRLTNEGHIAFELKRILVDNVNIHPMRIGLAG